MVGTLLLAVLLTQTGPAKPGASSLRGTIADVTSAAPIGDARVTLIELPRAATTTSDGRFEFQDIPPGKYTLTVSRIGFIFVRRRIEIVPNTVLEITVPLSEGTGAYQENVTVSADTAPMRDVGVSSETSLGSAGLQELRGVAADDPMRAMQALPGVATGDDFQAQFSVRGSAFRHVGIVTDGAATPQLLHAVHGVNDSGSIAMVNTDVLSRASLLAGPYPRRHGDWLGATLEFDMREGSRDRIATRLAISGTSASMVLEGPIGPSKRGSWLVSVRKSYIDWLIRKIEPDVSDTLGFVDAQGKVVYDLTSRQQLQFSFVAGNALYQKVDATSINQLRRATSIGTHASLAWRYTRSAFLLSQRVSVVNTDFHNRGTVEQELGHGLSRSVTWRGDVTWMPSKLWTVEAGAKTDAEHSDQVLRDFVVTAGKMRVRNEQSLGAETSIASGWGQVARRTTSSGFSAGVRVSTDSRDNWTRASPWLLAERLVGPFTFRAGIGKASQFPDLELRETKAGPALVPEDAFSVDAGVEHQLTKTIRWQVTGFSRDDSHVIRRVGEDRLVNGVRVAETPFPLFGAQLDGPTRGVDVIVGRRATSGLTGWVGYTFSHTRYHDTVTKENFDGDYDQRHTLNVFAQQRLSYRLAVSAKLRVGSNFPIIGYFSGQPETLKLAAIRNAVRLPLYSRLDLRANRTFTFNRRRVTLFVEVMNALGHTNLGQTDGFIRTTSSGGVSTFDAIDYAERLIPRVPSAGILIEF